MGVTGITWRGRSNSASNADTLDGDTNWPAGLLPSAWRVFPDARYTTNGVEPNARDRVTVELGLSAPPPQPVTLYLRSFDVDDPTAATNAVDNESTDDDNRGTTPARAGQFTGQSSGLLALTFAANVRETNAEFQVTMQPGDNFRVAVNADSNFLLRLENRDTTQHVGSTEAVMNANKQRICHPNVSGAPADRELRLSTNYASEVLTVWRFLHVEVDSMAAVTNNEVSGSITAIHGAGSSATNLVLNVNLRTGLTPNDLSANLSSGNDNGRFENGRIEIGANQVVTLNIMGNGDNVVREPVGFNIPAEITSGGITTSVGQVVALAGQVFTVSSSLGTNYYAGASLNVAGGVFAIATNNATTVTVSGTLILLFVLWDDDSALLPTTAPLGVLSQAMGRAYISILNDGGGVQANNETTNSFRANLTGTSMASDELSFNRQSSGTNAFWVVYLLMSHQYETASDSDLENEFGTGGVAWSITSNTNVAPGGSGTQAFVETVRDRVAYGATTGLLDRVVAHEIGHQMGLGHWDIGEPGVAGAVADNLMLRTVQSLSNNNAFYSDEHISIIRSRINTPGN